MTQLSYRIEIEGIVQGVGFRPFIYNLAVSVGIAGTVFNRGSGVIIEAEGTKEQMNAFIGSIRSDAPPLAAINSLTVIESEIVGYPDFSIGQSTKSFDSDIFIPPDVAICGDCTRELFDSSDRRFLYPFINCTNCGPRFTIIEDTPYDRINTTMKVFAMCPSCTTEYGNPADRRYHAQPVSCYACGPKLKLTDNAGKEVSGEEPVKKAAKLLTEGNIIAVKGIGGYHLACNALDPAAVKKLRERKHRDEKPFALMAADMGTIRKYCHADSEEEKLLSGSRKPIVLLRKKPGIIIPEEIAPGNPYLGMLLPYTPVHLLLFHEGTVSPKLELLVMTSGNLSSEPIFFNDDEAFEGLKNIADFFLSNNREIRTRVDDSVTRVFRGKEYPIRRSRGYVPEPVILASNIFANKSQVIGVGGELKNTFCIGKNGKFYISQHIGDMENLETYEAFEKGIGHLKGMLRAEPEAVAYDMHPDYFSTRYALSSDIKLKIPVQHHHAHLVSCMADNCLTGEVIGIIFDGTGFGEDGAIWGGEFLAGGYESFERFGHLAYTGMPGGERAIMEPWRMAASHIHKLAPETFKSPGPDNGLLISGINILWDVPAENLKTLGEMLDKGINCPQTSSMGRLFDAVSALVGIRGKITYEGQAAIELEYAAEGWDNDCYGFEVIAQGNHFHINTDGIFEGIIKDMKNKLPASIIASRFHNTAADIVLKGSIKLRNTTGFNRVVLGGGVFQNITLLRQSVMKLENNGFDVFIHSRVPTNDGGISLGQAAIAAAKISKGGII